MSEEVRVELDAKDIFEVVKWPICGLAVVLGMNMAATVVLLIRVFGG